MSPLRTVVRRSHRPRAAARSPDSVLRRPRAARISVPHRLRFALIALALFLVIEGGAIFAAGMFVIGCVCMHELYGMYERTSPVRLAGFLALAGLIAAAAYGSPTHPTLVLLAASVVLPVLFAMTLAGRRPSVGGMAITLLGIYWIGFGLAHAVLLRDLPTATAS